MNDPAVIRIASEHRQFLLSELFIVQSMLRFIIALVNHLDSLTQFFLKNVT